MARMLLRSLALLPLSLVMVVYLQLRYRDKEERYQRADDWGQKFKSWVME